MLIVFLLAACTLVGGTLQVDPVADQLPIFRNRTLRSIGTLTTSAGAPVEISDTSTLNTNLLKNAYFLDSLSHFVREKTPERIVHAKGAGAFGYFEPTRDISNYSKASLFALNTKTPVAVRFSVAQGSPETSRTLVGFAVKFYTIQGNFDIIGVNSDRFPLKDPANFVSFIHAFKRNPATNLKDSNMLWDYVTLHPETIYTLLRLFGDKGIPNCYRHMPGYSIETYVFTNANGGRTYGRIGFQPLAGVEYLNTTTAATIGGSDPDSCTRDLYRTIGNGSPVSWNVTLQIVPEEDMKTNGSDIIDITKTLSETKYPPVEIGKLVLNRNPTNYYADVEQLAFNPGNLVPGVEAGLDSTFDARVLFYRLAQEHRLGTNFNNILVNCPFRTQVLTYNRDGGPPVNFNEFDTPNYTPNSFFGSVPYTDKYRSPPIKVLETAPNNFEQANNYYTNEMPPDEQTRFVQLVVRSLCSTANDIQDRAVTVFGKINSALGASLSKALSDSNCRH